MSRRIGEDRADVERADPAGSSAGRCSGTGSVISSTNPITARSGEVVGDRRGTAGPTRARCRPRMRTQVDEEQGADVVGDVAAVDRVSRPARPLTGTAPATPRPRARSRPGKPPAASASSPASVAPPGGATASITASGSFVRSSSRGALERLRRRARERVDGSRPSAQPAADECLGEQGDVRGRARHHRHRRLELLLGEGDRMRRARPAGGPARRRDRRASARRARRSRGSRGPTSTGWFGITRITGTPGKAACEPRDGSRREHGEDRRRLAARAPRRPLERRRLHGEHERRRFRRPARQASPESLPRSPPPAPRREQRRDRQNSIASGRSSERAQPRAIAPAMLPAPRNQVSCRQA